MNDVYFLTSNAKKASDFSQFGLGVKEFHEEIPEVLSDDVEIVALYKAKATGMNNIVVEDTAFTVEGSGFRGTEIKYSFPLIKENSQLHGHNVLWQVSLCMKKDSKYYIATGATQGKLNYPGTEFGYHFNTIFTVEKNNEYVHFELLSEEEKIQYSPRFKALRKLSHAIKNSDFSELKIVEEKNVLQWDGAYQKEWSNIKKIKP